MNDIKDLSNPQYSQFIALSRYARWLPEENRRETWEETTGRYISFFKERFPNIEDSVWEDLYSAIREMKIMPSMRALMTAGKALDRDNVAAFNCSYLAVEGTGEEFELINGDILETIGEPITITIRNPICFDEAMYVLMCGAGVGFSVERQFVGNLPKVGKKLNRKIYKPLKKNYPGVDKDEISIYDKKENKIRVHDSKYGWSSAFRILIVELYNGNFGIRWDTSKVRAKGEPLRVFGGRASGPQPLEELFLFVKEIFSKASGRKLSSIECHDIMCKIGAVVVVGGVRRSACISLSNLTDSRMQSAKSGEWYLTEPQRALANNSVAYTEKPDIGIFMKEFLSLYESKSGERGIFNREAAERQVLKTGRRKGGYAWGTNPSLRAGTKVWTTEGILPIEALQDKKFTVRNLNGEESPALCWKSGENKQLYKITLQGGHVYYCTPEHDWPVWNGESFQKVATSDIEVGAYFPVVQQDSVFTGTEGTRDTGFLIGWNLGDGWITERSQGPQIGFIVSDGDREYGIHKKIAKILKDECNWTGALDDKTEINVNNEELRLMFRAAGVTHKSGGLPSEIWSKYSEEFVRGLIDGLFSADGCVGDRLVLTSAHEKLVRDVSEVLGFYGIRSTIKSSTGTSTFPNGNDYGKEYTRWDLQIKHQESLRQFNRVFRLTHKSKQDKLEALCTREVLPHTDGRIRVRSIELSDVYEDVWDISVKDDTHCFQVAHCITGNCSEIILRSEQFCNLSEVVVRSNDTYPDLVSKVRLATILGTLQSTLTDFKYLNPNWKKNTEDERLLGVSMTGIMDHPVLSGTVGGDGLIYLEDGYYTAPKWFDVGGTGATLSDILSELREVALETNEGWAKKLGVSQSAAICCVKPSGCNKKESMLITEDGILSLEEIGDCKGDEWQELDLTIVKDKSRSKSSQFYCNGYGETKKLLMSSGLEIECTPHHQYKVLTGGGEYQWKRADEINVDDILPFKVGGYDVGGKVQELKALNDKGSPQSREITTPEFLSSDLAWLLGLYLADGSTHTRGIRIAGDISKLSDLEKARDLASSLFGITGIIYERTHGNNADLYLNSTELLRWLGLNNLIKPKTADIRIPKVIRMSPKAVIEEYINGYGVGDGSNKTQQRTFCTTSKGMAEDLVVVLRAVGIDAKMRLMPPTESSFGNNMRYWVSERRGRKSEPRYISREVRTVWKQLDAHGLLDFNYDRVISIEDSYNYTFDIEVPEEHQYICNSYVSHNTVSQLVDSASGIHARFSPYYIRTVRADRKDPLSELMISEGVPHEENVMVGQDSWVFSFPMKSPEGAILNRDRTALEQLEHWLTYQRYWCCHKPSITIFVKEDEWLEVGAWVYKHFDEVSGISFLPHSEHTYQQAPYQEIDEETFNRLSSEMPKDINWNRLSEFEKVDTTKGSSTLACTGGVCEMVDLSEG